MGNMSGVARVLAVDDQEEILHLLSRMLTMAGHVVITAANGEEALQRLREQRPDVMVTDLMMPVMSGKELLERLRDDPEMTGLPVIVLSAFVDDGAIEGATVVMRKPFMQADLLASVEELAGA